MRRKNLRFFKVTRFFVGKRKKICYNGIMRTNDGKNKIQTGLTTDAKTSGLAFSCLLACFLGLSLAASILFVALKVEEPYPDWALYLQYLLPVAALATASVWYYAKVSKSPKTVWKEQKCHPKYYAIAIVLQIGLLSLSELNGLFLTWLERFGYKAQVSPLPSLNGFGVVGVILTVAVLPAVFEEIFFRGVLLNGCKAFSGIGAALVCGGIFALYHQNPAQTIYQFCCGFAFALVALRSGSVLPTVITHFLNNALIILLTKFGITSYTTPVYIVILCVSIPCLLVALGYLLFVDKRNGDAPTGTKQDFAFGALIGIVICAITWISALFIG